MPLVYSLADISPILPPTLVGVLDAEIYRRLVQEIQKTNSNGCCLGACFTCGCTLLLGPIGLIIGLWRIFEWHDNGTLWIYPENRYDTVVSVQPTVGGGGVSSASAVYVQEAYYVSPQQPGSNVTVVAATVSPLTQEQQPYQPHTVANTSYQPPTTAYAPATRDTPTNHSDV